VIFIFPHLSNIGQNIHFTISLVMLWFVMPVGFIINIKTSARPIDPGILLIKALS